MLDLSFIRENLDRVQEASNKKGKEVDFDRLLVLDGERRELIGKLNDLRTQQNAESDAIASASADQRQVMIEEVSQIKREIQDLESHLRPVEEELEALVYTVPNVIDPEVPFGKDEEDNVVVRTWGEQPSFDFEPRDHIVLATELNLMDVEKAAEVSGSRFAYLKGDLVMMQFALINMIFQALTDRKVIAHIIQDNGLDLPDTPFLPVIPPVMVRNEVQQAIHRVFGDQTYQFKEDGLNLVASAEHTLAPYHMNEIVDETRLPLRYIGYSTAFRKEAGTYGKDMGGIFRNHQFDKVELETFSRSETGAEEHKLMVGIQEYVTQQLGLPYQLVRVCTGDMGGADYSQFDIECWLPGQQRFRETHTADYMTDYQTRGVNARYKTAEGNTFLHTNDATVCALGRTLIAILENYQRADGSVDIPEVLQPYMGGRQVITS